MQLLQPGADRLPLARPSLKLVRACTASAAGGYPCERASPHCCAAVLLRWARSVDLHTFGAGHWPRQRRTHACIRLATCCASACKHASSWRPVGQAPCCLGARRGSRPATAMTPATLSMAGVRVSSVRRAEAHRTSLHICMLAIHAQMVDALSYFPGCFCIQVWGAQHAQHAVLGSTIARHRPLTPLAPCRGGYCSATNGICSAASDAARLQALLVAGGTCCERVRGLSCAAADRVHAGGSPPVHSPAGPSG